MIPDMRHDWEVIRKILFKVEALPSDSSELDANGLVADGIDKKATAYHVRILIDGGLVAQNCFEFCGQRSCRGHRLTWEGHEFLDKIRGSRCGTR